MLLVWAQLGDMSHTVLRRYFYQGSTLVRRPLTQPRMPLGLCSEVGAAEADASEDALEI